MKKNFSIKIKGDDIAFNELKISHVLDLQSPDTFIFRDIFNIIDNNLKKITNVTPEFFFDYLQKDILVCDCEIILRQYECENLDFNDFPTPIWLKIELLIRQIYALIIPYYIPYLNFTNESDFNDLPLTENLKKLRPISSEYYPHPLALHKAHLLIEYIKNLLEIAKATVLTGHNKQKRIIMQESDIAYWIWRQDDKDKILKTIHVAEIIYYVTLAKYPELKDKLPKNQNSIKDWIKIYAPPYAQKKGRLSKEHADKAQLLIDELINKYSQR